MRHVLILWVWIARAVQRVCCDWASLGASLPKARESDFEGLKVYVYDLPAKFHAGPLEEMEQLGKSFKSDCDFMRSPCSENRWAGSYSFARQYGAEVIVLRKLLASPNRVTDPKSADLFVVPYLSALDCRLSSRNPRCRSSVLSGEVFQHLHHYGLSTRQRHLFLGSCPVTSLPLTIQAQQLLVSEGASFGARPGHLHVPSATSEVAFQPRQLALSAKESPERDILFWLAQTPNNAVRYEVQEQLVRFRDQHTAEQLQRLQQLNLTKNLRVYQGLLRNNNSFGRPDMPQCLAEMQRTVFCPALPAETSSGLVRLFDILRAGCIPVVVSFRTRWGSGVSWWRHDGPPLEWSLPFTWEVSWRQLVVEVREEQLSTVGFVDSCLQLSREEIAAKQQEILRVRSLLSYDLVGGHRDAFSLLMDGIRAALVNLVSQPSTLGRYSEVCDTTPRHSGFRAMLPSRASENEKAWTHSFGEMSCLPLHRWQPPGGFLEALGPSFQMDHYVTTKMMKFSWRSPALWIRELHVLEGDVNVSAGSTAFLACRHQGLPEACHDLLVDEGSKVRVAYCYQSEIAPPTPKTTCDLIPTAAQLPSVGPESPSGGRWQMVTWLCNASEYAENLAAQLQRLGESEQNLAFDVVLYSACGAGGARAALHHVHGLLLAVQAGSTATVPEGVVLIRGDMVSAGAFPEKLLDVLVQQPKAQEPLKRLTVFEGAVGQGACGYCGGFGVLFTWHCPLHRFGPSMRGCPQAAAFTTRSLLAASSSEWAVASTTDLKEGTEQFDILIALLVKALQDANASDAAFLDQRLSLEDPFAACLGAFGTQRFVEKTGMPPYYVVDFKLQAMDCFAHGGAYATVETGLKAWLASPRNAVQEEEAVKQELRKMGLDAMTFLEVFGVCVPDLCRYNITGLAWHYVMDHQMFRSSFWQVPPVPSQARIRRFFRNRTFFAPDA